MLPPETLVVLGDEHVGPVSSVWSAASVAAATRAAPQPCDTLGNAMVWAVARLRGAARTANWPWVRRTDGRVLSPAYLRAYLRTQIKSPNG